MFGFIFRSAVIIGSIYVASPVIMGRATQRVDANTTDAILPLARAAAALEPAKALDPASTLSLAAKLCETSPETCATAARAVTATVADTVSNQIKNGFSRSPEPTPTPAAPSQAPSQPPSRATSPAPTHARAPTPPTHTAARAEAMKLGELMEAAATPPVRRDAAKPATKTN